MPEAWVNIIWIAAAALGIAALVLLIAFITSGITFYSPKKHHGKPYSMPPGEQYKCLKQQMHEMVGRMEAIPCEWVEITSDDGLKLRARYYHVREGAPVAICVHGYRANALRDFCGIGEFCIKEGQNLLLLDQRGQGRSEGRYMTFGIRERFDLLRWIEYINGRCGNNTPILLYGISMGGATVLMAAGLGLPGNVRGIAADCPFSSAKDIICKVCRDMHLPAFILYPFIRLGARVFGGFDPEAATAAEALRASKLPVMIIHGEDDRFVPCDMSREIARANPETVRIHTFPEAGHGISYMQDMPRYHSLVRAFVQEVLAVKKA